MIFLPYNTDAPIYHRPIATGIIVAINVALFFGTVFQVHLENIESESIEFLILQFDTINPLQWITHAFMHASLDHLLGNMFFLWAFGLVIEGKIGALWFTMLYFGIAFVDGAAVQIPMFLMGGGSGALGASGVIFGLMIIAATWAPENEVDCFYWVFRSMGTAEIRIIALCAFFMMLQIVFLFLKGFSMSSEMLHVIGAMIGAPIGFLMLRQDLVDCEGWDVVSRNSWMHQYDLFMTPKQRARFQTKTHTIANPVAQALAMHGSIPVVPIAPSVVKTIPIAEAAPTRPAAPTQSAVATAPAASTQTAPVTANFLNRLRKTPEAPPTPELVFDPKSHPEFNRLAFTFRQSIETGNTFMAGQSFSQLDQLKLTMGLSEKMIFQYVAMLGKNQKWLDAIRPLHLISEREGTLANEARIRIAQIQLTVLKKPTYAIETLKQIPEGLDQKPELLAKRQQLMSAALKQV